jgi:hypothetical protein
VDEELRIPRTAPMSTVLATLAATSMRLGQPTTVDISAFMGDIVLGIPNQHYEKWFNALEAESYDSEASSRLEPTQVRYATKTVSPEHWTFVIRSVS